MFNFRRMFTEGKEWFSIFPFHIFIFWYLTHVNSMKMFEISLILDELKKVANF